MAIARTAAKDTEAVQRGRFWPLLMLGMTLVACSGEDPAEDSSAAQFALPSAVEVADPSTPLDDMEVVEDSSEEVANRFLGFADKLRRRDFVAARDWLADDFAGHSPDELTELSSDELPLGARRTVFDTEEPKIVDADGFLAAFEAWMGDWARVEKVQWKVKGAEFQTGSPFWGKVRFRVTCLGTGPDGGPEALVGFGYGRVVRSGGQWLLQRFELNSWKREWRASYLFTDVATSAGVAHAGIRFGQRGNSSFAWNGAAAGDVDGDGLDDLFVPSRPKNFLYRALPTGGFEDEGAERRLAAPAGGTGAVFCDYDSDGDQDLFVADVGWREADGNPGGNPLRLYQNDGDGRFDEVGAKLGFGVRSSAYSLVVLDAERDGFPDIYVCNYGRIEAEPNNSWTQATNGKTDALFRNVGGERFQDVASEVGIVDSSWSYAAAAADYDVDGDADIYVANDYGLNSLWRNAGDGTFEDVAEALQVQDLGNGMGATWGDLDNDGLLDMYVANMSSTAGTRILGRLSKKEGVWKDLLKMAAGNTIFERDGDTFARVPGDKGGIGGNWAWSPVLVDLDLDGRLDVYNANGFVTGDTLADT